MLQFKIKEKIESRGILNPHSWMVKHCKISGLSATKLLSNKQHSVNLKHLSKLCENLHCTPNELLYWQQTPASPLLSTHPCITELPPPPTVTSFKKLLQHLQPKEVEEFYNELLATNEAKFKK